MSGFYQIANFDRLKSNDYTIELVINNKPMVFKNGFGLIWFLWTTIVFRFVRTYNGEMIQPFGVTTTCVNFMLFEMVVDR